MKTRLPLCLASWLFTLAVAPVVVAQTTPTPPLTGDIDINGTYDDSFVYHNASSDPATITVTGSVTMRGIIRNERLFTSEGDLTLTGGSSSSLTIDGNASNQDWGGVLSARNVTINGLGGLAFTGNASNPSDEDSDYLYGGAIDSGDSLKISSISGDVLFEGNTLTGRTVAGGAISAGAGSSSAPSLLESSVNGTRMPSATFTGIQGNLSFINNTITTEEGSYRPYQSNASGGAVSVEGAIDIDHISGQTVFRGNRVEGLCYGSGGAIFAVEGSLTSNNGIEFSDNAVNLRLADTDGEVQGSGGAINIAYGSLTIDHNRQGITFANNAVTVTDGAGHEYGSLYGGAISADNGGLVIAYNEGDIVFSGNSATSPENEHSGSITAAGGAIQTAQDVAITGNYDSISFVDNLAKADQAYGGAIAAQGRGMQPEPSMLSTDDSSPSMLGVVSLSGNRKQILFQGNRAEGYYNAMGGSIASGNRVELTGNEGDVLFIRNQANGGLGTSSPEPQSVSSSMSNGITGGGAIYSSGRLSITGNKGQVLFSGNSASASGKTFVAGGAIFSENGVTISGNEGDVIFYGNKATDGSWKAVGGAIASAGDVTLRADKSDIVFEGNRMGSGVSNAIFMLGSAQNNQPSRVAAYSSYNANVLNMSATAGHRIVFHDGIAFIPTAFSIVLNEGGEEGTILFTGTGAVVELGTDRYDTQGYVAPKIDTTLGGGRLVIEQGAIYGAGLDPGVFRVTGNAAIRLDGELSELLTEDLIYSGNGTLDMAGGTVTADRTITLHHAQALVSKGGRLNANTITLHGGIIHDVKSPTHLIVNATDSFAISGNLNMRDHGLDVYRTVKFAQPFEIHVLNAEAAIHDGNLDQILSETTNSSHVGDETSNQGHWEMEWRNGDRDLYAIWVLEKAMDSPMDVVVPEEQGHLIPNSVWSTASNMNSMKESGYGQVGLARFTMQHDNNYWINGIGDFAIHNSVGKTDGYDYSGGGYAVGADRKWTKNFVGGLAFGQVFGTNHSRSYDASIDQKTIAGMLYGAWFHEISKKDILLVQGSAAYGVTDNSLHTAYTDGTSSRGSWDNDAWLLALRGSWNHALNDNWTVSPFIGIEYEDITQKAFSEGGGKARRFGKSTLRNMSLPVGAGITRQLGFSNGMKWFNTLELSYLPDICRDNPESGVSRIDTSDAWTARGISQARNAVRAELYSRLFINQTWSTYAGYTFEGRDHSVFHRVTLGVSASF